MASEIYVDQVDLLLEVIPFVTKHRDFAIKGGTALNLFHLNLPRLSVDIDLCFLPVKNRKESFSDIHRMLNEIKLDLSKTLGCEVIPTKPLTGEHEAFKRKKFRFARGVVGGHPKKMVAAARLEQVST